MGLSEIKPDDLKLVEELLTWMKKNKKDYTNTFRELSKEDNDLFKDQEGKLWLEKYQERLKDEKNTPENRKQIMEQSNPKFILRNYLAQEAIQDAENSDFSKLYNLIEVLKKPYEENVNFEDYAKVPPDWSKKLEISCSS